MKKLFTFFLAFLCTFIFAQSFNITGKVLDSKSAPIEDATIYLMLAKDSSVINYTNSSKEGFFDLKANKTTESILFKVSADGFTEFSKVLTGLDKSQSFGNINLKKDTVKQIEGVLIQVSAPIKIKKDTVEYNAASFKVRPDSKVEDLLKALPGFEMDNDGKITANGRDVDKILVNGKPFFDENGKIALKNLPADVIKKIQLTTTKTKEEELSGEKPKSQNQTVNITIDEKKNQGYMARVSAGYGTDDRYESSAFLSYFKKDTKVSLIGSANNINSSGFSNDEVFGSMGGGRNANQFGVSGASNGLQESYTLGVNYTDKFGKQVDLERMSLRYSGNNVETKSTVDRTTFLPNYALQTQSKNSGKNDNNSYNFDTGVRLNINPTTSIYFSPSFGTSSSTNQSQGEGTTYRDGTLVNDTKSTSRSTSEQDSFSSRLVFSKRFKNLKRNLTVSMNTAINNGTTDNYMQSQTKFYQSTDPDDYRNQLTRNKNVSTNFNANIDYAEPISDSAKIGITLNYRNSDTFSQRLVNDFDAASGGYDLFNQSLYNLVNQKREELVPGLSYRWEKKKFNLRASSSLNLTSLNFNSHYNNLDFALDKNFVLPEYNVSFDYKFSENKRLYFSNNGSFSTPSAMQLIPYKDTSNPLLTQEGNPLLKNSWSNNSSVNFNSFNQLKNFNYYFRISYSFQNNSIVTKRVYDNSGKQFVTYENINGNKSANANLGMNKTFKWEGNKLSVGPSVNLSYSKQNGFVDGDIYSAKSYNVNSGLNIRYELKDRIMIRPSYRISYRFSDYENYSIKSSKVSSNSFNLETTNYFGSDKDWTIGNDFSYNTNSNIAPGFKRNFYFWNASIGYRFFKKQLSARLMAYDILNQNQSVKRTITDTYMEDREDLILKRYVMFTLSYNLNNFGGKSGSGKGNKKAFR